MSGISVAELEASGAFEGMEDAELGVRTKIEGELAEVIAKGCALAFTWDSQQLTKARALIAPGSEDGEVPAGMFHGRIVLTQKVKRSATETVRKYKDGKEIPVTINRAKREWVIATPVVDNEA